MNKKIISSVLLITVISSFGKILGLIRESILALHFGASGSTDAFKIAFSIPDIFIAIFSAAIAQTFIPVYSDYIKAGNKRKTQNFLNSVFTSISIVSIAIVVIGIIASRMIVNIIAPGFDGETKQAAALMTSIMFPGAIFMILANLSSAYLQAHEKYFSSSLMWYSYNICIILGLAVFKGYGIKVAAYGAALGFVGMLLIQLPSMLKQGFKFRPVIDFKNEGYLKIRQLVVPVLISSAFNQVYLIINRILGSNLSAGSISALDYAGRVGILVNTIIVVSIVNVIYPRLAKLESSPEKFRLLFSRTMWLISVIMLPLVSLMFIFRGQIIYILFQRGAFTGKDTEITAAILGFLSLSIVGIAYREILNRAFFSLKDTRTPMINGIITILINIALNLIFIGFMGVYGLALGTSAASVISALMLFLRLRKKLGHINGRAIAGGFAKAVLASTGMSVFVYLLKSEMFHMEGSTLAVLLKVVLMTAAGFAVYMGILLLLNADRLKAARGGIFFKGKEIINRRG